MENNNLGSVGEITELIFVAKEMEKYEHLGVVSAITEEVYFAKHAK